MLVLLSSLILSKWSFISVISPYEFSIADTSSDDFGSYESGGILLQIKKPLAVSYVSFFMHTEKY